MWGVLNLIRSVLISFYSISILLLNELASINLLEFYFYSNVFCNLLTYKWGIKGFLVSLNLLKSFGGNYFFIEIVFENIVVKF